MSENISGADVAAVQAEDALDGRAPALELAAEPTDAYEPASEEELAAEPADDAFDEAVARVRKAVDANPRLREIHYETLKYCIEMRELGQLEDMIGSLPQFTNCAQPQYRLILFMEECGGLARFDLDEDGAIVTDERKEGLTEDEIDDLVLTYGFLTTDAGAAIAEEMRPEKRMGKLFDLFPKRLQGYLDVLGFCTEPRTFKEIDAFMAGSDILKSGSLNPFTDVPLKPSVLIDQLERNGGLVWNGSWNITKEGRALLEAMTQGV